MVVLSRTLQPMLAPRAVLRAFSSTSRIQNVARVTLVGRLGADAETLTTQNGNELIRYSIATNSGPADNRQTSWWKVQSFEVRPEAKERMTQMLKKGSLVYVEGNAAMRKWEGEGGKTEQALSITQVSYRILANPGERANGNEGSENNE